jgi:hypothetical protein
VEPVFTEFEVGGKKFRCGRLDARTQYHLNRKISPTIVRVEKHAASGPGGKVTLFDVIEPIAEDLRAMAMEDANFILDTCLSVTQRSQDQSGTELWSPVVNGKQIMFADIDGADLVQIQVNVIKANLGNFTVGSLLK